MTTKISAKPAHATCKLCAKPTRITLEQTQGMAIYHAHCAEVLR